VTGIGTVAVLVASPAAARAVGGIPLAARAALAAHGAGASEVWLLGPAVPAAVERPLARRGVPVARLTNATAAAALVSRPGVLVLAGDVAVDRDALAPALAVAPSEMVRPVVGPIPAREPHALVVPGSRMPAVCRAVLEGARSPGEVAGRLGDPAGPVVRIAVGFARRLGPDAPAAVLEAALLDHLAAHTRVRDGYLTVIDRRLARPLTRLFLRAPLSPTQITLLGVGVGVGGAGGLAAGSYAAAVLGALALLVSNVLDCVDGEVARARLEESARGARIDVVGDYVVHLAIFAGLALGLARRGPPPAGLWAGLALVTGVAAAMAGMHVLFVRPALVGGGDLHWAGPGDGVRGTEVGLLAERLASRDYTYLVLACALAGRLEWFLYLAAVGAWLFAIGLAAWALTVRRMDARPS
jgi:phosphatidylglycerophosphate synthase